MYEIDEKIYEILDKQADHLQVILGIVCNSSLPSNESDVIKLRLQKAAEGFGDIQALIRAWNLLSITESNLGKLPLGGTIWQTAI